MCSAQSSNELEPSILHYCTLKAYNEEKYWIESNTKTSMTIWTKLNQSNGILILTIPRRIFLPMYEKIRGGEESKVQWVFCIFNFSLCFDCGLLDKSIWSWSTNGNRAKRLDTCTYPWESLKSHGNVTTVTFVNVKCYWKSMSVGVANSTNERKQKYFANKWKYRQNTKIHTKMAIRDSNPKIYMRYSQ